MLPSVPCPACVTSHDPDMQRIADDDDLYLGWDDRQNPTTDVAKPNPRAAR